MIDITDPSRWLELNQNLLGDKMINHIILPGSNKSSAYTINKKQLIDLPLKYKIFSHTLFSKWAITQSYSILEQLRMGVRYLDLRISFAPSQSGVKRFYTNHIFALTTLKKALSQIKQFLTESPNEFLIINAQIDHLQHNRYDINDSLKHDLVAYIKYNLDTLLIPKKNRFPTYNEVLAMGSARIFFLCHNSGHHQ
jgi:hypothetical protein